MMVLPDGGKGFKILCLVVLIQYADSDFIIRIIYKLHVLAVYFYCYHVYCFTIYSDHFIWAIVLLCVLTKLNKRRYDMI